MRVDHRDRLRPLQAASEPWAQMRLLLRQRRGIERAILDAEIPPRGLGGGDGRRQ